MSHKHIMTCNMQRNAEKGGKGEMYIVKPGIWREN